MTSVGKPNKADTALSFLISTYNIFTVKPLAVKLILKVTSPLSFKVSTWYILHRNCLAQAVQSGNNDDADRITLEETFQAAIKRLK